LPKLTLFKCEICNSTVKYFKDHLKKIHQITEKEYEEMLANEKTPPKIEPVRCEICENHVKHIVPHLLKTHQLNMAQYKDLVENKSFENNMKLERDNQSPRNKEYIERISSENIKTENFNMDSSYSERSDSSYSERSVNFDSGKPSKAEIQDKTNTRCSSCQEELHTRKKFVQHCQLVHQIKFKTKAGLAVPPPPSAPEAYLSSSFNSSVSGDVAGKTGLMTFDPSSIDEAGTRGVKRRLIRGEGSIPCDQCNKMFSSVSNMGKHKRLNCHPADGNTE